MPQRTDLYTILNSYANKNRSPHIDITAFIDFLEKYAKRIAGERPEWAVWAEDTGKKVWAELSRLGDEKRCIIRTDDAGTSIVMPRFYAEMVAQAYQSIDNDADLPFPDEKSLAVTIPQDQIRPIHLEADFPSYLANPQEAPLPLIRIVFPEDAGEALVLAGMIPHLIMEASLLKVRNYLRSHGNREYFQHKLGAQFQGKENQLRDMFNLILIRPLDCASGIRQSGDFIFYFWAYFCSLVRTDIKKKKERLSEEEAVLQAVYLIECFNAHYKSLAVKSRERELAFKELELHLDRAPFLYTLDQISKFSDNKGVPLLGRYSREDLEAYLRMKTTQGETLPDLFIIHGLGDEQWFVKKSKFLALCARLLVEARPKVKKAVSQRWFKILKAYARESAMENDGEFEKLLSRYTAELAPVLTAVLQNRQLYLVYQELERSQAIHESSRLFNKGRLIPLSTLLLVKRKDILADARIMLPFWYTIPFLIAIIAFFKNSRKKQKERAGAEEAAEGAGENRAEPDAEQVQAAALTLAEQFVPPGHTLDSYLDDTASRWSKLLNKKARQNLIDDVNSLIKDRLRHTMRLQNRGRVTAHFINTLAGKIIRETPSLHQISERDALEIYFQLYIIKLLTKVKF
jgi:hypothetical protein